MEKACILSLVQELQKQHKFKNYYNIPGKIKQSSVAFVLRISPQNQHFKELNTTLLDYIRSYNLQNPEENVFQFAQLSQILDKFSEVKFQCVLIQRQINAKDQHSGQLAFPGGHVDNDENDFQASLREVHEEIGINLNQNSLYLGKLPNNFYARKARNGESLYTSLNIFLHVSDEPNTKFVKQEHEVRDVRWIDMELFFQVSDKSIEIYKFSGQLNVNMLPSILQYTAKSATENFKYGEFCSMQIGMDNVLWGLTFHFFIYILSSIKSSYIDGVDSPVLSNIANLIQKSDHYNLVFEKNYMLGWLISFITRQAHKINRGKQFKYVKPSQLYFDEKRNYLSLYLVSLLSAGLIAFPFYKCSL